MSRIAYLDCVGGLAGDMLLAALLDAGAELEHLRSVPVVLGIGGVEISVERVERQGIGALHLRIEASAEHAHRDYRELRRLVEEADLPERVRSRSLDAFRRLAEVEGAIHGVPADEVHFHELGSLDTLVDVCGAFWLLDELGVEHVASSPLPFARGLTRAAHGVLPLPAPATLELLAGVPFVGVDTEAELVTPTGAAIAATVVAEWGSLPPLMLERVGYGAGTKELDDRPNIVRVVIGEGVGTDPRDLAPVVLLETNLDDFLPELVPDAVERCFAAGALDVWTVPAQMKKGRPGFVLSALAKPEAESMVARALLEETSALGVRVSRLSRYELQREERSVEVGGGTVRVKIGMLDGRVVNVAPEHDDCAALASTTGRSVKSVWAEAFARAQE
jgi:pyridinium-3,5-bisthiocarboxylic acid mononucleotide nickel chelatase